MEDIVESIDDKSLFKAIIVIGGPGSGKSFIIQNIFKNKAKILNSDLIFEFLLKKNNLSLKIDKNNPEIHKQQMELRNKAIELLKTPIGNYVNGMLPLIIDGTGKNYNKIEIQKKNLENIGYDVYCVMVNTTLGISLQRNKQRERQVPDDLVSRAWNEVQQNIGKFQNLFGNNFFVVDNNRNEVNEKQLNRIEQLTLGSPLKNRKGNEVVNWLRANNKSYYSDFFKKDLSGTLHEKIIRIFTKK